MVNAENVKKNDSLVINGVNRKVSFIIHETRGDIDYIVIHLFLAGSSDGQRLWAREGDKYRFTV